MRLPVLLNRMLKKRTVTFNAPEMLISAIKSVTTTNEPRGSLLGALAQAKQAGLAPKTVIDIGAAFGQFTADAVKFFPEAFYLLVEPLEEYRPNLDACLGNPKVKIVYAAAAAKSGKTIIHVHKDLVGSSLFLEQEDSDVNGIPRTVPTKTVDELVAFHQLPPPYFIKIDTQGNEVETLKGSTKTLKQTDYVLLEVSFFKVFKGGPEFTEVIRFMHKRGFVTYDMFNPLYRMLDNAMMQMDICFVSEESAFRKYHFYATREQREAQDRQLIEWGRKMREGEGG